MMPILLTIGSIICVLGFIATLWYAKKQENRERDMSVGSSMSKHRIMANPAALFYIVALLLLAGGWILWAALY